MLRYLLLSGWLVCSLLVSCQMSDPTNPIYREVPETYFAGPALAAAQAIRAGDVAALDKVFAQHPRLDPNQPGNRGVTLLLWAYAHHSVPMLQALVRHGADVNRQLRLPHERPQNQGGNWLEDTHLINIAAKGPQDKLLMALLELGANPSAKDYQQEPALINAIFVRQYQRLKILLDHGADINGTDSSGATAAVILARLNYFEMVYYLLERGADWRALDSTVAFHVQESDIGTEENIAWQIKVKHWLMAHGVKFPVPTAGASYYTTIRAKWEQTPEATLGASSSTRWAASPTSWVSPGSR